MTTTPASSDRAARAGLLLDMSENAAPQQLGAGDDEGGGSTADAQVRRAALLTPQLAEICAIKMFRERTEGPHALIIDPVAVCPTVEEIVIGQAAVLAALGEKGSDKRSHANSLCTDGLVDLEQGLGYLLCDRYAGTMPTPLEARGVGKRAADRVPGKKEKERWKDKAQAARKAARKAGADAEAVEAAGLAARAKAEAVFVTAEVSVRGLERATLPQPEPSEPPAMPSAQSPKPSKPDQEPMSAQAEACLDMARSPEAASAIKCAFSALSSSRRGRDTYFNEDLEIAQVRYKHALRRLQRAYPGVFCGWSEDAPERMYDWVLMWECMGHSIPAAVASSHVCRCNLQKAAEHNRERVMGCGFLSALP